MILIPWKNKAHETNFWAPTNSPINAWRDMETLMSRFFAEPFFSRQGESAIGEWMPSVDLKETDDSFIVKMEAPGVEPKDLDISLAGNRLFIRGEKKEESEKKGENFHHVERRFGTFSRAVELPSSIDEDKVSADYDKGVFTITVKKQAATKPKKITIQTAGQTAG